MTKKEELTNKIIQASVAEFMNRGFESGSMENIAKEAQVSKRTLYKYFPTKDAIYDALVDTLLETVCSQPGVPYSKAEPIEKQIKNIIDQKIELMTSPDYIKISKLVLSEVMKGKKISDEHIAKFYESELKFLKWIDAAKKDGKIISKQANDLISNQVHSIVKGQLFYPVIFGIKKLTNQDIKNAKKTTVEFFLNSFC